jgi:hypothetical protein
MAEKTRGWDVTKIITMVWLVLTCLQFTVWLLSCLISWHLVSPWWLWPAGVGGVLVGGIWLATAKVRTR